MQQHLLDAIVETIAHRIADSVTREVRASLGHPPPESELRAPASKVCAPPDDAELVDVEQAAIITSIPKRTLDNWRGKHAQRRGKGPAFVKLGAGRNALVRYRRSDLNEWVRAHLVSRG